MPNTEFKQFAVHLFEEHASTLPVWWSLRQTPRTVVYLDAHLDLQRTSDASIRALQRCRSLNEFHALEAPHHLNQSDHYAYGIENFLYAAQRLKLITRLIWVVPPHIPRQYSSALLEYIQQMDGISFDELTSFREIGQGALRGTLLGLDITLCSYDQLHTLDLPSTYNLDIDIDYFVQVPEDRLWAEPGEVMQHILKTLGPPAVATISRAVSSGFTPLHLRFIADYIQAVLRQDIHTETHYRSLCLAVKKLDADLAQAAVEICQNLLAAHPNCAATLHLLSIALEAIDTPPAEVKLRRQQAIETDEAYAFDLSRAASGFPNRFRKLDRQQLQSLSDQLNSMQGDTRAYAEIAMARLYTAAGQLEAAEQLLDKQRGELQNHHELALDIARGWLQRNEPERALPLLNIAAQAVKTRTTATLYLGEWYQATGDTERALDHYQKASHYAPAWSLPLEKQLDCLGQMNDQQNKNKLAKLAKLVQQRKLSLHQLTSRAVKNY